jgi:hypothetical protein
MPDKALESVPGGSCPYNFAKPACEDAEPQAPRDLTNGASGQKMPKAPVLNLEQAANLPLSNVHFHLGAEHKSEEYNVEPSDELKEAYAAGAGRRLASAPVKPGWMCSNDDFSAEQLEDNYEWKFCKGQMHVGLSYEVHYVHSSAGYTAEMLEGADSDGIDDGLGGAANGRGLRNPMIVVQGQVYHIVHGGSHTPTKAEMFGAWTVDGHTDAVMYAGSTTGQSHNNEVCSPFAITWHVDKKCYDVSPETFDNLCKHMKEEFDMYGDTYPHGSREILDPRWVVPADQVAQLA